jgi:hypothetical protein
MYKKQPITIDLIYDLAKKGILLYRASPSHIRFKIDTSMLPQRHPTEDKRLQSRIDDNHAQLDTCIEKMIHDLTIKIESGNYNLSGNEWTLVKLWRLVDFTPIENYLIERGIIERDIMRRGILSDLDCEKISDVLSDMQQHFTPHLIQLFLSYHDNRV